MVEKNMLLAIGKKIGKHDIRNLSKLQIFLLIEVLKHNKVRNKKDFLIEVYLKYS